MSRHANTFDATQKAMDAARALAGQRLCAGAKALADVLPPGGVLLTIKLPRLRGAVRCFLCWPGQLLEKCVASGEVIAETPVDDMFMMRPEMAAEVVSKAGGSSLKKAAFMGANGEALRATIDAACIVRVHAKRTGVLLAMSEPGRPDVLNAAYHPLTLQDLAPRLN